MCTADGHCFERAAIEQWMAQRRGQRSAVPSPLTNLPLASRALTPNTALRCLVERLQQLVEEGEGAAA